MSGVEAPGRRLRLWGGLLAGPLALLWTQGAAYAVAVSGCPGGGPFVHLVHLLGLSAAGAGVWVAHREWARSARPLPDDAPGEPGRGRWMAAAGVLTSGAFALVVAAQWLPAFVLGVCAGG